MDWETLGKLWAVLLGTNLFLILYERIVKTFRK